MDSQLLPEIAAIISSQVEIFEAGARIATVTAIPTTDDIPIRDRNAWLKVPDVICVFVDMANSTRLSATTEERVMAGAYELFTGTAVRLFDAFEAAYIDVRGDGVFALFNKGAEHRALAAAVTFKTFGETTFAAKMSISGKDVGCHLGIDQKTVLVRKVGLRRSDERTDRQNEVWAGKPVNMAAKLASLSQPGEILISERFFEKLSHPYALHGCGCTPDGVRGWGNTGVLWTSEDVSGLTRFDFQTAYKLRPKWCLNHGAEYCRTLRGLG
jgi:class 3 adenylate cyclase